MIIYSVAYYDETWTYQCIAFRTYSAAYMYAQGLRSVGYHAPVLDMVVIQSGSAQASVLHTF